MGLLWKVARLSLREKVRSITWRELRELLLLHIRRSAEVVQATDHDTSLWRIPEQEGTLHSLEGGFFINIFIFGLKSPWEEEVESVTVERDVWGFSSILYLLPTQPNY